MSARRDYSGKLVVITGGASGLGLALAHELSKQGAIPVLIDREPRTAPYPVELADVSDPVALATAIRRIIEAHGEIDLAISNAAIDMTGEAHTFTAAEWQKIIETNLFGATNLISAIYPSMVMRGSGQIILIASGAGLIGFPGGSPYTASKSGLIGLSSALRTEAATYGVSVSVACPPILQTPLLENGATKPGVNRSAFLASLQKTPMPAEKAARYILKHASSDKSPIIFPAGLKLGHKLATVFPAFGEMIRKGILKKLNRYGRE